MTEYEQCGYIALTESKKALHIRMGDDHYFISVKQLLKVLKGEKEFTSVSKPVEEEEEDEFAEVEKELFGEELG